MLVPHRPQPRPRGHGRARWITRWKPALNAFAVTFEGRVEITIDKKNNSSYTVDLADASEEYLQSPCPDEFRGGGSVAVGVRVLWLTSLL